MRYPVESNEAPKAIGPYSQGIKAGGFVFASGQVALDPKTGEMVGDDVAAQTDRDRKSTRLNSSHIQKSRMPSSA